VDAVTLAWGSGILKPPGPVWGVQTHDPPVLTGSRTSKAPCPDWGVQFLGAPPGTSWVPDAWSPGWSRPLEPSGIARRVQNPRATSPSWGVWTPGAASPVMILNYKT